MHEIEGYDKLIQRNVSFSAYLPFCVSPSKDGSLVAITASYPVYSVIIINIASSDFSHYSVTYMGAPFEILYNQGNILFSDRYGISLLDGKVALLFPDESRRPHLEGIASPQAIWYAYRGATTTYAWKISVDKLYSLEKQLNDKELNLSAQNKQNLLMLYNTSQELHSDGSSKVIIPDAWKAAAERLLKKSVKA